MLYLGNLKEIGSSNHGLLLKRIQQLLAGQYHSVSSDSLVEDLAIKYVGKLKGCSKEYFGKKDLSVKGGLLAKQELGRIDLQSFRPISALEGGGCWLCHQIIEQLGIPAFLRSKGKWTGAEIELMLLNLQGRLLHPTSERGTAIWIEERSSVKSLMSDVQRVNDDKLRDAALNWLSVKTDLEDYLYEEVCSKLEIETKRYLYDLTNTYFEGRMLGSDLATYGRSKEKRSDAPIVSMGLLTNDLGFIRRSDFYAGNVSEPETLEDFYEILQSSPGVATDAGIGTRANIEELARRKIPYICVVREGFKSYNIDFDKGETFTHHTSNGQSYEVTLQSREHDFKVAEKTHKDYLIFVKSEAKQAKEDSMVSKQKARFEEGLKRIEQSLSKARGHKTIAQVHQRIGRLKAKNSSVSKAFDIQMKENEKNVTELKWTYDRSAEQRNGTYIIRRSEPIVDLKEAWKDYCALTEIEAVNRCCKTDLNLRPVYHQKDASIKAHLFLTLIAFTVVQFIRHQLAKEDIHWSWKEIVEIMDTQKVVNSKFTNDLDEWFLLSNWSEPSFKTKQIYQALNLKLKPMNGFFFKIKKNGS
ncbi:MAG: IS1634 family transposase [Saprospiraceae bacterium]